MSEVKQIRKEFFATNRQRAEDEVTARGYTRDGYMASVAFGTKVNELLENWYEDETGLSR
jgi:hypothetical protein